jgi:hypothetical protein
MSSDINLFHLESSKSKLRFWDEQNKIYPPLTTFDEFPVIDMSPHSAIAFECPTMVVLNKLHLDSFRSGKQIYLLVNYFLTKRDNALKQLKLYVERKVGQVDWNRVTFVSVPADTKRIASRRSQIRDIILYTFDMRSSLTWTDANRATMSDDGDCLISINFMYDPIPTPERIELDFVIGEKSE